MSEFCEVVSCINGGAGVARRHRMHGAQQPPQPSSSSSCRSTFRHSPWPMRWPSSAGNRAGRSPTRLTWPRGGVQRQSQARTIPPPRLACCFRARASRGAARVSARRSWRSRARAPQPARQPRRRSMRCRSSASGRRRPRARSTTCRLDFTGGMVARGARVGVLGNRDYMNTPFSINSYTEKTIEDQQAVTVGDVARDDASVRFVGPDRRHPRRLLHPWPSGGRRQRRRDRLRRHLRRRAELSAVHGLHRARGSPEGSCGVPYGMSPASSIGGTVNVVPKRAGEVDITRFTAD